MKVQLNSLYVFLTCATLGGILFGISCKRDPIKNEEESETEIAITPLARPIGSVKGQASSKTIGPAGGVLSSADGQLKISIPAGALTEEKLILVQPIEQTNIAGIGLSYRLTPHNVTFKKAVTLTFDWKAVTDQVGLPQTLGFAYQQEDQVWKYVGASTTDTVQKTISYETTHFSDWSLMNRLSLEPYEASIEPGQTQSVRALIYTQTKWDDLLTPLTGAGQGTEPGYPVGTPAALPSKFIDSWELAGPGKIVKADASIVTYQAPVSVNGSATAVVSLKLKAPRAGTYLLLSNIHISGNGWIELSIAGGGPVKFPASSAAKSGNTYLLSNPENEGGGYFLLRWNGGVGSYKYEISNGGNHFHFQTSKTTYMSRYIDKIVKDLVPSGGQIQITKIDKGWVEGMFNVTNAGYGPMLLDITSANGRFRAKIYDAVTPGK
ncbi:MULTISPECIES: hypothetical protein [Sphingobacterium]|uniref:hypothetical protein n=1 Tax=Sphingobacterium TaxID=28453 RepID=UPI00257A389D|nr:MULTISPECIES: hypothetical protein [Sphingobacterium]